MNSYTKIFKYLKIVLVISVLNCTAFYYTENAQAQSTTVEQKILLVENSFIVGGVFVVDYQIKGTNLNINSTLGTLNTDISYDSTKLRFISGTNWNNGLSEINGYNTNIQSNSVEQNFNRWVRISITALNVANSNPGGLNLSTNYVTVVRINFRILNTNNAVSLNIKDITNQVGLFANNGNNPDSYIINNQTLSTPENLIESPLPVELSEFNCNVNKRNVTLSWMTDYEHNNKGFDIERKGFDKNEWLNIGYVIGNGNKNTITRYSFTDTKLQAGKFNYRLKQTDINGNFKYYNLSNEVEISLPKKYNLSQNYPNPFNPATKIDYELPADSKVSLIIFDVLGRSINTIVNEKQQAGYYTIQFNASSISSGTYFYRLIANSEGKENIITKKLSVIK